MPGLLGSPFPKFSALPRLGQPHAASPSRGSGLGQGPAYITCNCGQSFASLSQLERHMSTEHPENTNLVSKEGEDNDDSTLGVIYPRPKAIFSSLRALHNAAHRASSIYCIHTFKYSENISFYRYHECDTLHCPHFPNPITFPCLLVVKFRFYSFY